MWAHCPVRFLLPVPRWWGFSAPADRAELGEYNYVTATLGGIHHRCTSGVMSCWLTYRLLSPSFSSNSSLFASSLLFLIFLFSYPKSPPACFCWQPAAHHCPNMHVGKNTSKCNVYVCQKISYTSFITLSFLGTNILVRVLFIYGLTHTHTCTKTTVF